MFLAFLIEKLNLICLVLFPINPRSLRLFSSEANILKLFELKAKAFELWENKVVGAQIFSDINHLFEFVLLLNLGLRSEKYMEDSVPLTLTLPELKYPIGSEPKEKKVSINQDSTSMYISIVERKTVYGILPRSIVTRVCLLMLLLVESILLSKNNKGTFPLEYVGTEATNETPVSPIASQSIETPVFTPIQTHQMVTEGTYDSTEPLTGITSATNKEPLTEIISATNKQDDTHAVHNTPSSPVSSLISRVIEETQHLQTSASSPLSTLFENGADVEIATSDDATCRFWYPGNVFATNLCDGVEKVAVTLFADQKRVTVTAEKIRHKPPADDREKKFEIMDNVEAFYSKGWSSGQVIMILGENTFSVYLNSSMETLEFKASDLRIHREWLDGVWKMADELNYNSLCIFRIDILIFVVLAHTPLHETASRQGEANPDQTQQDTKEPMNENISQNISDTQRLTRARAKNLREQNKTDIRNGVEMLKVEYSTRFVTKRKDKETSESVSIDKIRPQPPPGDTNGFELMDKVEAYHNDGWCSGEVHIILSNDIYSVRFNSSTEFIQFNLSDLRIPKEWVDGVWKMEKEHVDVAFAMLNEKRIEQSSWFSEQGIPKACFVPVQFLETGWVAVVRGLIRPNKMWMQDVDIVYGVAHERLVDHFIGVEIHLMENTITIFHCMLTRLKKTSNPKTGRDNVNDIVPFQVKKAEGLPKIKLPFNCGLFVVKMLECKSLGLKKISSINDDTAMDLRSKLCCEMFDQFMDKDFQEGCRRMVALLFKQSVLVSLCESTVKSLNC
ncbi:hypothetical protein Bca52824_074962 [Brassica carinata]|uniref:Agenet domain-containing protein n=1 Tax=Brassica carinata TaxID=52824 RepID=A0A8X7PRH3_BRACI|nr:hypothetical protein Bca52824_074962 [Brassica carinata]